MKLITNSPHFRQVLYWCHGMLFLCTPVLIIKWVWLLVKEALDLREHTSPSTECLLEAIKITLECNNSIFNKKHNRQNRGTAMGSHNACSYADLAMTTIDRRILDVNNRPDDVLFPPDW